MKERKPADQKILDAKIASLEERWSPGRENPAIGMPEGTLRALAGMGDEGARRAVRLADRWKSDEVPGPLLDDFLCGLISSKTVRNRDSVKTGPKGKISVGKKKVAYDKWELTVWLYENYLKENSGKTGK